jgi:carbon monoxide dehydrogenase subunit G
MRLAVLILIPAVLLGLAAVRATATGNEDIEVKVQRSAGVVIVDASFAVSASPQEVWAVLTDFEHMARFVGNLKSSSVVARTDDTVTVSQSGEASVGPIKFAFDSVRELRLIPFETIRSRLVSGNMNQFEGITRLAAEAAGTRVTYHSEAVPKAWVPPLVGPSFVEHETREQLGDLRAEIMRRKSGAAGAGPTKAASPAN